MVVDGCELLVSYGKKEEALISAKSTTSVIVLVMRPSELSSREIRTLKDGRKFIKMVYAPKPDG
jgi:hypothetical protein